MERATSKVVLLVVLNLILTVYVTRAGSPRSALFKTDSHLSGKVFSELFLFEVQAYTSKACILMCLGNDACSAVTVTSSALTSQVTCRGHGSPGQKLTTQSSSVADPDTVFYKMSETCSTPSECSSWLGEGCSLDSDCGVVNAECVIGQCACRPFYYLYSEGEDSCLANPNRVNLVCSLDSDCGAANSECDSGQCVCRPFYYYSEGADGCLERSTWLNKGCSSDGDCGVVNSRCVSGQCVCRPDYFYSEGADLCVASCSEANLQKNYLTYHDQDFYGSDRDDPYCDSAFTYQECQMECQRTCNAYVAPKCVNVALGRDWLGRQRCYIKYAFTAADSLGADGGVHFMKRTCV